MISDIFSAIFDLPTVLCVVRWVGREVGRGLTYPGHPGLQYPNSPEVVLHHAFPFTPSLEQVLKVFPKSSVNGN